MGGRPRLGETKEEANERRARERALKEQELNQEPSPTAEPKTAVETPENPINPLNEYVDDYVKLKENGYAKDYVDEKDDEGFQEKDFGKENDFMSSLILDDFDDEEEYSSYGERTMSDYIEGKLLEEQERIYKQSQGLEEDRELYI